MIPQLNFQNQLLTVADLQALDRQYSRFSEGYVDGLQNDRPETTVDDEYWTGYQTGMRQHWAAQLMEMTS